jgi:hypothetical protein
MSTSTTSALAPGVRMEIAERLLRTARWTLWASLLAVLNALLQFVAPGKNFFIGFGVTATQSAPMAGLLVTLAAAAVLTILGEIGGRRQLWALLLALALYAGDAILITKVHDTVDWLGFLVHVVIFFLLWQSVRVISDWDALERLEAKKPSTIPAAPVEREVSTQTANDMLKDLNLEMKSTQGRK